MSVRHWIKNGRARMPHKYRAPALQHCPHKKAVVIKSFDTTPRKPNSARRKTAKVRLQNRRYVRVYFEGIGLNRLQPHSVVLVRGGGPRDLPGVRYHTIRGQFDLPALIRYRRGRSKYGVKKPKINLVVKPELKTISPRFRANLKYFRRKYLVYAHVPALKFKASRRRYWLIKSRLPQ